MADDIFDNPADNWSPDELDELLKEFEPEVEAEEKKSDEATAKLTKAVRKVAERQAKAEERERVEKLTSEFYAKASDDAKALADVLLAGVTDETKVKRMLDLANAKAQAMGKSKEEEAEVDEETSTEQAFAAPPQSAPIPPKDPEAELIERIGRGGQDGQNALLEALYPDGFASLHPPAA